MIDVKKFLLADYIVFFGYFLVALAVALWASRRPKDHDRTSEDFFLAGRALPWWIIGTSLIASNISTEQIIGMNGTAFESGIAVISYSWIGACVAILIVAKFFLPTFLKTRIYSMPEFLEKRFDHRVSTGMGIFWLLMYVFVNLTSVMSLGAITLDSVLGIPIIWGIVGLACVSAAYTIYGGLSSVVWTDFLHVAVLVVGGFAVVCFGLNAITDTGGIVAGFAACMKAAPEKFHTVLDASHNELPWPGIFFGGLWIAAISYWGCNQYIIQRALAAKSRREAQNGLLFASFLSLIVSIIIVLPGIIAFVLYRDVITSRDQAFPVLVRELVPIGSKGLIIAALVAAIVSSLNSMTNSVATIFTMDVYRRLFRRSASERELVITGRVASAVALIVAVCCAPAVVRMGRLFAFIQEYSGFIFPGVFTTFLFGLFWKRATSDAALWAAVCSIPVSALLKFALPDVAFLNRMTITFIILSVLVIIISLCSKQRPAEKALFDEEVSLKTSGIFKAGAIAILGIVTALYLYFW